MATENKCDACGSNSNWMFNGTTFFSGGNTELYHECVCGNGQTISFPENRSFWLNRTPTFFDVEGSDQLETMYKENVNDFNFAEFTHVCDFPGCDNEIRVIGNAYPPWMICFYLEGNCRMVPLENREGMLLKKDYCNDHKEIGDQTFVMINTERVKVPRA